MNRRRPWPFDTELAGKGLMLLHPKQGAPLVQKSQTDLSRVVPSDYRFSSTSPLKERPYPYIDLSLGFGLDQEDFDNGAPQRGRYSYALGADLSTGEWLKGPQIDSLLPAVRDAWAWSKGFFELNDLLYGLAGRFVLRADSDAAWPVAQDLGLGVHALSVEVFASNGGSGDSLAFLAVEGDKAWSFDGSSWTQFSTFTALDWLVVGPDLYRAHDINLLNKVSTSAGDPTNEANYTADFEIGDKSAAIVSLARTPSQVLLVFKTDGVWSLDSNGASVRLFPALQFEPGADNGRVVGYFGNDVYCRYGDSLYRITPDLVLEPIGPERMAANTSPVRGQVTAFCGNSSLFAYAGIVNESGAGHLLKLGGFTADDAATGGLLRRTDNWHGSLSQTLDGQHIRSLYVSDVRAPAGHTRTYAGLSDGTVLWWVNPCVPNPAACEAYVFSEIDGQVILPRWHAGFVDTAKVLRSVTISGPRIDASNWAEFAYTTDLEAMQDPAKVAFGYWDPNLAANTWDDLAGYDWDALADRGAWQDLNVHFDNSIRDKIVVGPTPPSPLLQFRVTLKSVGNGSPRLSSVTIGYALRPDRVMDVAMTVNASRGQLKRDWTPMRLGETQIRTLCEAAVDASDPVKTILATHDALDVSWLDLAESYGWDDLLGEWTAGLQMRGICVSEPGPVYGTWPRLSAYDWDTLATYDWDQLTSL